MYNQLWFIQKAVSDVGYMNRHKTCEYPDIEKALIEWFKQYGNRNIPISNPIFQEKTKDIVKLIVTQTKISNNTR